jgi:hypothetical protein
MRILMVQVVKNIHGQSPRGNASARCSRRIFVLLMALLMLCPMLAWASPGGLMGQSVFVFRENTKQIWTLWDQPNGRHLGYANGVLLTDASIWIDRRKQQLVIERQKRMPHAGILGIVSGWEIPPEAEGWTLVEYNPFRSLEFTARDRPSGQHKTLCSARIAALMPDRRSLRVWHPTFR